MKSTRYLCDCGATNTIEFTERPYPGKPAMFYCHDCGKPSFDLCTQCGHQSPAGSGHRFCNGCGAGHEAIRIGITVIDVDQTVLVVVIPIVVTIVALCILPNATIEIAHKINQWMGNHPWPVTIITAHPQWRDWMGIGIIVGLLSPGYFGPLYALLTGRSQAPATLRILDYFAPDDRAEKSAETMGKALALRSRIATGWRGVRQRMGKPKKRP